MVVEIRQQRLGIRLFLLKYIITGEFNENRRVLFDTYMHKVLPHPIFPGTFHIRRIIF